MHFIVFSFCSVEYPAVVLPNCTAMELLRDLYNPVWWLLVHAASKDLKGASPAGKLNVSFYFNLNLNSSKCKSTFRKKLIRVGIH